MPKITHAREIDYATANAAAKKLAAGEHVTTREEAALNRVKDFYRKEAINEILDSFPKATFWQVVKTQPQKVYQMAERFGFPAKAGEDLDLRAFLLWVFDYLKGTRPSTSESRTAEDDALERQRMLRGDLLELQLAQKRGELVNAADVRSLFSVTGELLRKCGEGLERRFGPDPAEALLDTLEDVLATATAFFDELGEQEQDEPESADE